jgi:hypothetical protein
VQLTQVIFAVCVVNVLAFFNSEYFRSYFTNEDVKAIDTRFAAIRARMQPGVLVGYVADGETEPSPGNVDMLSMRRFFITQFAVAPAVMVHSTEPQTVVGNFSSEDQAKKLIEQQGLSVQQNFGDGVYLLRHGSEAQ